MCSDVQKDKLEEKIRKKIKLYCTPGIYSNQILTIATVICCVQSYLKYILCGRLPICILFLRFWGDNHKKGKEKEQRIHGSSSVMDVVKRHSSLRLKGKYFSHHCCLTTNSAELLKGTGLGDSQNNHMQLKVNKKFTAVNCKCINKFITFLICKTRNWGKKPTVLNTRYLLIVQQPSIC